MNALNKLAAIADELDKIGDYNTASDVTDVMRRIAQQMPAQTPPVQTGQFDESAWKQTFGDKYKQFVQMVSAAKDDQTPMTPANPAAMQGLYDEMVYIASNYLKDDPEIFKIMKWVVHAKQGLF